MTNNKVIPIKMITINTLSSRIDYVLLFLQETQQIGIWFCTIVWIVEKWHFFYKVL